MTLNEFYSIVVKHIVAPTIPQHTGKLEVTGSRESYTLEEKKVLEKTSLINHRIFVPFMAIDMKEKFVFPIPFTDKEGKLELAPKQKKEFQIYAQQNSSRCKYDWCT